MTYLMKTLIYGLVYPDPTLLFNKLKNADGAEINNIKTETEVHHRKAEQAYKTLREYTERSENDS